VQWRRRRAAKHNTPEALLASSAPSAARQVPDGTWGTSAPAAGEAKNSWRAPGLLPRVDMMKKSRDLLLEPAEKLRGLQIWK